MMTRMVEDTASQPSLELLVAVDDLKERAREITEGIAALRELAARPDGCRAVAFIANALAVAAAAAADTAAMLREELVVGK